MFANIKSDFRRYGVLAERKPSLISIFLIALKIPGIQATVIYRFGRWSSIVFKGRMLAFIRYFFLAIYYCLSRLIIKMYGIDIDCRAIIGKGLRISHFAGIRIGPCEMGEFCTVYQHVKIGSANHIASGEFPYIGSYVWIGAHARITGNVTLGDNSTISAGTVVIKDVRPSNLVVGYPARVICTLYDNRHLLNING